MKQPPRPDAEPTKPTFTGGGKFKYNILTQPGINIPFQTPTSTKVVRGRILPCFDFDADADDFDTAWLPYRDSGVIRSDEHAEWNQWFFPFEVYTFHGPAKRSFFSPRVKQRLHIDCEAQEALDPIARMNYLVNKDPKWTHLGHLSASTYKAAPGTPPPPLGRARMMVLMNFFGTFGERDPANFVLMLPEGGMEFIKTQLNKFRKASVKVRDKNWPDYMFGDVTDPNTGLVAWSTLKPAFGDKMVNTLTFSRVDDSASDVEELPITKDILAGRLNFFDTDSGIYIPSPQEVLDMVIEDGAVPLDFIKAACGSYLNVPSGPVVRKTEPENTETSSYGSDDPPWQPKVTAAPNPPAEEEEEDAIPFLPPSKSSKPAAAPLGASALSADELEELKSGQEESKQDYAKILANLAAAIPSAKR